jgi:hypothetical protein
MACVITGAANIVGAIADCYRNGARITSIIGSSISPIVGSIIAWVTSVIPFTAYRAEHGAG